MKREGLVRLAIQITAYLIAGFTILLSIFDYFLEQRGSALAAWN